MQYILTTGWEDGIADLTQRLIHELAAGKKVLWLISGGSNIPASVQVMEHIPSDTSHGLTILPVDERYGPIGHSESNLFQLLEAGFIPKQATILPVLVDGLSLEATAEHYQQLTTTAFEAADCIIAQLGMGGDSHLAGILPHSPATEPSDALAVGYDSQPFIRLTLTFTALLRITSAYIFAFGEAKRQALESLLNSETSPVDQPAQILKQLPEAFLYNDQVGENV